jgi:hypothetical protein
MNKRNQRHAKLFYQKNTMYNEQENQAQQGRGRDVQAGQFHEENNNQKKAKRKDPSRDPLDGSKDKSFEDSQLQNILGSDLGDEGEECESYLLLDMSKNKNSKTDNSFMGLLEHKQSLSSVSSSFYHDIYHPKFSNFLYMENSEQSYKELRKDTFMESFSSRKEPFDFQSFMATMPSEIKRNIHFDHYQHEQDFSAKKQYQQLLKEQLFEKLNPESEPRLALSHPDTAKKGKIHYFPLVNNSKPFICNLTNN